LIIAVIWGLFEWRVKSENKSFIRLSILNSVALGLLVVVVMMAGSLILLPVLAMPGLGRSTPPSMINQLETIDAGLTEAQQAAKKNDNLAVAWQLNRASNALSFLSNRPAFSTWLQIGDQQTADAVTKSIEKTKAQIDAANLVIGSGDTKELIKSIEAVQQAFEPLRAATKRVREKEKKDGR
jgi:hypothetical protein